MPGASRREVTALADVIDLERYPIDRLDSPAGQDLVARCGRELAATGASDVEIGPAAGHDAGVVLRVRLAGRMRYGRIETRPRPAPAQ